MLADRSRKAVKEAAAYLKSCGIWLPRFTLTATPPPGEAALGNSFVVLEGNKITLNIGRYEDSFSRNWFAMHELGHVLWRAHRPLRWKVFRHHFGAATPPDYDDIVDAEAWRTSSQGKLSWYAGHHRPRHEPSWYGARGGGEERFCELIAFMYAHCGGFLNKPPRDLSLLWSDCWNHGLSRMIPATVGTEHL
jgi:hypothetical protein